MHSRYTSIAMPTGTAEAYVADGGGPGVLLYVDAIGLRPQIERMADRIAGWGYTVLVPHLFWRDGSSAHLAPTHPLDTDERRAVFMGPALERVNAYTPDVSGPDTDVWVTALARITGNDGPFGVVGYCMGARLAMRTAGRHPESFAACAGFHGGRLVTDAPDSPHRELPHAAAEFLFRHADNDASMTPDDVRHLDAAFVAAHLTAQNSIYPGTRHGFTMADTSVYDRNATERHFDELEALFRRTLAR